MYLPSQATAIRRQTAKEPKGPATRATPKPASSAYNRKSGIILHSKVCRKRSLVVVMAAFSMVVGVYYIAVNVVAVIVVVGIDRNIGLSGTAE